MLSINKTIENGKADFALTGRMDTITAPEFEQALRQSLDGVSELTLDFAQLDYISSAGLRVMLGLHRSLPMGGKTKVTNCNSVIKEVFSVTGFDGILEIS